MKDTPYDRSYLKNKNVYAYAWDNVWEWGQGDRAYKLANADYKVDNFYPLPVSWNLKVNTATIVTDTHPFTRAGHVLLLTL